MKEKPWPKNMTAKEIRHEMDLLASLIDANENEYEELERELIRRGLKP